MFSDLLARRVPQAEIVIGIDRLFIFVIRDRQSAAGGDRLQILIKFNHLTHHRTAHLLQMRVVHTGANMHMNPHQLQLVALNHLQRRGKIAIPDPVLAVLAAGIGFLAMAVAEARVNAQPDAVTRRDFAQLAQHIN